MAHRKEAKQRWHRLLCNWAWQVSCSCGFKSQWYRDKTSAMQEWRRAHPQLEPPPVFKEFTDGG